MGLRILSNEFICWGTEQKSKPRPFKPERVGHPPVRSTPRALTCSETRCSVDEMSNKSVPVEGAVGAARIYLRFRFHRSAALALSLASVMSIAPTTLAMPGLKIAVKTISPNQSGFDSEKITYIQDDRRRVEDRRQFPTSVWPGGPTVFVPAPRIVSITRCDLNQTFPP